MARSRDGSNVFADWQWWMVDPLRESGVIFTIAASMETGGLLGVECRLERRNPRLYRSWRGYMGKSFVEKLLQAKKAEKHETTVANDEELADLVPHVYELLTKKLQDGKKTIEPASLIIFCRKGSFHSCLTHKGLDLKWWGEAPTLKASLEALEASIGSEEGEETHTNGQTRAGRV